MQSAPAASSTDPAATQQHSPPHLPRPRPRPPRRTNALPCLTSHSWVSRGSHTTQPGGPGCRGMAEGYTPVSVHVGMGKSMQRGTRCTHVLNNGSRVGTKHPALPNGARHPTRVLRVPARQRRLPLFPIQRQQRGPTLLHRCRWATHEGRASTASRRLPQALLTQGCRPGRCQAALSLWR